MGRGPVVNARQFPFSAVVGQDHLKLALLLAAIDPRIGGVLARGEKGSGKTTLARGLAALLPGDAPFVELPLGATEDRVLGSIDLAATLSVGSEVARAGLLADADGGVVYVDEINLLADHLVDSLLDVAASGVLRLERDGITVTRPARFVLVGTMNPEEGELRPQLLDRFGLCADVTAPDEIADRIAIVTRRLAHDASAHDEPPVGADADLAARLAATQPAGLDHDVIAFAAALALAAGAQGLRADLVLCRAAAALAGWEGRAVTSTTDVERVAPLALAHRRRRDPFDPPSMSPDELDEAIDRARDQLRGDARGSEAPDTGGHDSSTDPAVVGPARTARLDKGRTSNASATGRRDTAPGARGRLVRDVAMDDSNGAGLAIAATVRNVAARGDTTVAPGDVRAAVREQRAGALIVVAVDVSGSMGASDRLEAATGVVLGLLTDAYQQRDRVSLVTFGGDEARVVLAPTGSIEIARTRLDHLTTGGATPLAAGLRTALDIARRATGNGAHRRAVLVVITDGRATSPDPATAFDEAMTVAGQIATASDLSALVVDAESGPARLGLAAELAAAMGAPCTPLESFGVSMVREASGARQ
jgi:magnesium chelatase subunit D